MDNSMFEDPEQDPVVAEILFDLLDPCPQIAELIGHRPHGDPGFGQDARVGIIVDDGDQLGNPPDTQRRHDTEFAEAASDQIRQHGLLLDEELARGGASARPAARPS